MHLLVATLVVATALISSAGQAPNPDKPVTPESSDGDAALEPVADADTGAEQPEAQDPSEFSTTVTGAGNSKGPSTPGYRAKSSVTADDMLHRQSRSAPDAVRYEPGVFVQQTAHSQGSVFIRGLTGQQTLLMFDGVRLNNSTYRQGPNQYFFTVDSATIARIDIHRGGGSTRYGSDALGGVLLAVPIEAPIGETRAWGLAPSLSLNGGTADLSVGGRAALATHLGDSLGFVGGVGARRVGQLQGGGVLSTPGDAPQERVPRYADDGRTQLGTGFNELTADGRLTWRPKPNHKLTLAAYIYRQFDAPRTDQCPAPFAPFNECLKYDEQFRTLAYAAWSTNNGSGLLNKARATISWQRQHERRTLSRPVSLVENLGRDTVDTFGISFKATSKRWSPTDSLGVKLNYGANTYYDKIDSRAWTKFTDTDDVFSLSRGQYLTDSSYIYGGAFVEASVYTSEFFRLRVGTRASWVAASAEADPESDSAGVSRRWFPVVGYLGIEARLAEGLTLLANVDRSFRAPNLDDLTSRQQAGPGFQFENPNLQAESAATYEVGLRLSAPLRLDIWAFSTSLSNAISRASRTTAQCPPSSGACQASWNRFQLVNASDSSDIFGFEASMWVPMPAGFSFQGSMSWTYGEGPNLAEGSPNAQGLDDRVPLSRIPPLNGTAELMWQPAEGLIASASLRWAAPQTRLAVTDISDGRIPTGGTPGFTVVDLRTTYRFDASWVAALVFENVFDTTYRYHGSSVNGPGRGAVLQVTYSPTFASGP